MKKALSLILVLTVFAGMALGSGTDKKKEETKQIVNGESADTKESGTENATPIATEEKTEANKTSSVPTIEQQVVYDADGIVITAVEYTHDDFWNSDGIKFLIENNTQQNVTVGVNALIVNGFMVTDLFAADVASGTKKNETINLLSNELDAAGITTVGEIEIYFHIYDSDTWKDIAAPDRVVIQTSNYSTMDTEADTSGSVLYDEGGIKIIGKYVDENSFWGKSVVLYIENNTEKNVIIQADNLSINGYSLTSLFSSTVYAGRKAVDDITLLSSELEENSITSVDEVTLKFDIMDEKFSTIKKTEAITFKTK
ncbi:MAG: hypothetical protein VZR13_04510 [Saccharofermentanaceae bacterium]|nr:hypothetical protein [Saccharofermentanaceae bacterium]